VKDSSTVSLEARQSFFLKKYSKLPTHLLDRSS